MVTKGNSHTPKALFAAIKFLAQALPKRSAPTFLELLFGAMLTQPTPCVGIVVIPG